MTPPVPLHAAPGPAPGAVLLVLVVAAALTAYLCAARSPRHRTPWPRRRTAAAGCAALALALVPAVSPVLPGRPFTAHAVEHVLLGMAAPVALAVAAPMTLVLRTAPRARRPLARVLHARALRVLVHPAVAVALHTAGLYALYLTPLVGLASRSDAVHAAVHLHVFASGCLVAWALVGRDPLPGRSGVTARIVALALAAGAHAALAKLMYGHGPPGGAAIDPADWRDGAVAMFHAGDAVEVAMLVLVLRAWYLRPRPTVAGVGRLAARGVPRRRAGTGGHGTTAT